MAETMRHDQPITELNPLWELFDLLPASAMEALWVYFKTVSILTILKITLAYSPWEILAF